MNDEPFSDAGPKARACLERAVQFGFQRRDVTGLTANGIVYGVQLGVALMHVDPAWADDACRELGTLVVTEGLLLGRAMPPAAQVRQTLLDEAQRLIARAAELEAAADDR